MGSIAAIRPYFRTRIDALGYTEWKDGLNIENIPSNILNQSYHMSVVSTDPIAQNQADLDTENQITINFFFKGYRYPALAIDTALSSSETILLDVLKAENRIGDDLINVRLISLNHFELDDSNDNAIRTEMIFSCRVVLGTT